MGKLESKFQADLIKELYMMYPDAIILKNDASYIQGIPDILVLAGNKWAALEIKKNSKATHRPNQEYYVDKMNNMSFAAFIYPENKEEVLDGLQQALESRW